MHAGGQSKLWCKPRVDKRGGRCNAEGPTPDSPQVRDWVAEPPSSGRFPCCNGDGILLVVHLPGMQLTLAAPHCCPGALACEAGLPWLASQRTLLSRPSGCRDSNPTAMFLPSSAPFPHLFQPHPLTTQALQRPAPAGAREHYSKWLGFCQPDLEAVGPDEGGVPPAFPICLAMFFSRHCAEWCRLSRWVDSPASIGSISRVCVWARRAPICPCSVRTRAGILPA